MIDRPLPLQRILGGLAATLIGFSLLLNMLLILNDLNITYYYQYVPYRIHLVLFSPSVDVYSSAITLIFFGMLTAFSLSKEKNKLTQRMFSLIIILLSILSLIEVKYSIYTALIFSVIQLYLLKRRLPFFKKYIYFTPISFFFPLLIIEIGAFLSTLFFDLELYFISPFLAQRLTDTSIQLFYFIYPINHYLLLLILIGSLCLLFVPLNKIKGRCDIKDGDKDPASYLFYLSIVSAVLITLYILLRYDKPPGVDVEWYFEKSSTLDDSSYRLQPEPRIIVVSIIKVLGTLFSIPVETTLKIAPILFIVLNALSVYFLAQKLFHNHQVSGFSCLISVLTFTTTVALYSGILANWLSISFLNFSLTFFLMSVEENQLKQRLVYILSSTSFLILSSITHPWTGLLSIMILSFVFLSSIIMLSQKPSKKNVRREIYGTAVPLIITIIFFIFTYSSTDIGLLSWGSFFTFQEGFMDRLLFALKLYVGGYFIAPLIYLLGLIGYKLLISHKSLSKRLLALWNLISLILLFLVEQWLQWRILYVTPFAIFTALGITFLYKGIPDKMGIERIARILLIVTLLFMIVNSTLRAVRFLPVS